MAGTPVRKVLFDYPGSALLVIQDEAGGMVEEARCPLADGDDPQARARLNKLSEKYSSLPTFITFDGGKTFTQLEPENLRLRAKVSGQSTTLWPK